MGVVHRNDSIIKDQGVSTNNDAVARMRIDELEKKIEEGSGSASAYSEQLTTVARVMMAIPSNAALVSDDLAKTIPDMFPVWPNGVDSEGFYIKDQIVKDEVDGHLYRIVPEKVKPVESQPPHGEGMLAVYRPIDGDGHSGTEDDPIPFIYGMDVSKGKYYSYEGHVYRAELDMPNCVWYPGTAGLWQWSLIS